MPKSLSPLLSALLLPGLFIGCACQKTQAPSTVQLNTEIDKVSYILGYSTGQSFREQSVDINSDAFLRGLKEGISKEEMTPIMSEDEMRDTMQNFRMSLMEKRKKETEEASAKNQKEGEAFLSANKNKAGVTALPNGLQYEIITAGTGPKPGADDSVNVEYTGTLINGKVFDSTEKRGKAATFPVGSTIPGMSEILRLMPVGSTWKVYIPSNLAYGTQGAGNMIGPNETLIFNLHLVSIEAKTESKTGNAPAPKAAKKK